MQHEIVIKDSRHDIVINTEKGTAASWLLDKAAWYAEKLVSGEYKGALLISIPSEMDNKDAEKMIWRIHDLTNEYPAMRIKKDG